MSKVEEYLKHAAKCREMGQTMIPVYRQQLEEMAKTWEELAKMHEQQLRSFNKRMGGLTIEVELPSESKRNERE